MAPLLGALLLALLPLMALAAPAQQSEALQQGEPDIQQAFTPSASFDNNGRLWLAWVFDGRVYVNYSDDRGKNYSPPVALNQQQQAIHHNGEARPHILVDEQGHIYVSYTEKLPKRFTGHIRFSRSLDGGKHFSEPLIVNDNIEQISHRFVSMALDKQGALHLVWLDGRDFVAAKRQGKEYSGSALYYARSSDQGASFEPNRKLADFTCQCCRIALALDQQQRPVAMWRHIFSEAGKPANRDHGLLIIDQQPQLKRVTFDDWQVEACPHHGPTLAIDEQGRYHMAWFNLLEQQHPALFYGYSDDQGTTVKGLLQFGHSETLPEHPYLLMHRQQLNLVWKTFDGTTTKVMRLRSNDRGASWQAPQSIASSQDESDHPMLVSDGDTLYLSWQRADEGYLFQELKP